MKFNKLSLAANIALIFFCAPSMAEKCRIGDVYAMSPFDMKCIEFDSTCDIPTGWIELQSCDFAKAGESSNLNGVKPKRIRDIDDFGDGKSNLFQRAIEGDLPEFMKKSAPQNTGDSSFYSEKKPAEAKRESFFFGR